jgi:hypothetical protein
MSDFLSRLPLSLDTRIRLAARRLRKPGHLCLVSEVGRFPHGTYRLAHGGKLWATANEGSGAIFQFSLPLRQGA